MGRRPDQHHRAILHVRKEYILLRLVEPVYLIDEQYGAWPAKFRTGSVADLADFRDIRYHAGTSYEVPPGRPRYHLGERRLAASGRTEKDYVSDAVCLDDTPKQFSLAQYVILPDNLINCPWTHASRQRLCFTVFHGQNYTIKSFPPIY